MARKFAVIGVEKYGAEIARELAKKGAEVHAFDVSQARTEALKDEVALAIALDATDPKILRSKGIDQMDAVVVAIGENFEATVLTSMALKDMGVPRVIARASGANQLRILQKLGIEEILAPEMEIATTVAERLVNPSITGFLQLPDGFEIAEIKAPAGIANRSLEDIDLRNKYRLTLITLKREYEIKDEQSGDINVEEHIIGVPKSETMIYETDTLVVFGKLGDVKKFIEVNV